MAGLTKKFKLSIHWTLLLFSDDSPNIMWTTYSNLIQRLKNRIVENLFEAMFNQMF